MRQTIVCVLLAFLAACTKTNAPADTRQATVYMMDGTSVTGTVTATSPSEVTIAEAGGGSRTIPMNQVKSIEYSDVAPPAAATAPAASAQPAPTAAAPPPPASETAHENHYHPPEAAIQTKTFVLGPGTEVPVRTEETIDSAKAVEGQTYAAEVTRNVLDADGAVVIPAGSNAKIVIRSASKGGRIRGASDLVLDLDSVSIEGRSYKLSTVDIERKGTEGVGANRRTAEYSGGGAAIGAIIGAIAGGGKGAAIGAGSGAGAGALTQILTKGRSVKVPAETILAFQLDRPLRVTAQQ